MPPLTLQSSVKLSSGHSLPVLGLGVYQNSSDCYSACLAALKAGYRHIDSAQAYKNEAEVGRAVRDAINELGIKREDIFITSKIVSRNHGYESTLQGVDESLEKMGLSYIDLFLIHDPLSGSRKRLDTYRALVEKVREGKLRSIGVSNFGVKHLEELLAQKFEIAPAVNQVELHPFCQLRDITTFCREHDILLEAYCPITRGVYFDHPVVASTATAHSRTPAQVLIRWSLQKGFVPLPKSTSETRIAENADVFDWELTDEEMAALDALDESETRVPAEPLSKKWAGNEASPDQPMKRAGSVSWGGGVVEWKKGDGLD